MKTEHQLLGCLCCCLPVFAYVCACVCVCVCVHFVLFCISVSIYLSIYLSVYLSIFFCLTVSSLYLYTPTYTYKFTSYVCAHTLVMYTDRQTDRHAYISYVYIMRNRYACVYVWSVPLVIVYRVSSTASPPSPLRRRCKQLRGVTQCKFVNSAGCPWLGPTAKQVMLFSFLVGFAWAEGLLRHESFHHPIHPPTSLSRTWERLFVALR